MSEFSEVLRVVEERGRADEANIYFTRRGFSVIPLASPDFRNSTGRALSVYQQHRSEALPVSAPASFTATEFSNMLRAARGSRAALLALRRHIAWRLHPDRRVDHALTQEITLAQCNGAIDAALETFGASDRE